MVRAFVRSLRSARATVAGARFGSLPLAAQASFQSPRHVKWFYATDQTIGGAG